MEPTNRFAFTSWKQPQIYCKSTDYCIWQPEISANGVLHYQGYIEMNKDYTIPGLKRALKDKSMHIEQARASRLQNIEYCSKSPTKAGITVLYIKRENI